MKFLFLCSPFSKDNRWNVTEKETKFPWSNLGILVESFPMVICFFFLPQLRLRSKGAKLSNVAKGELQQVFIVRGPRIDTARCSIPGIKGHFWTFSEVLLNTWLQLPLFLPRLCKQTKCVQDSVGVGRKITRFCIFDSSCCPSYGDGGALLREIRNALVFCDRLLLSFLHLFP